MERASSLSSVPVVAVRLSGAEEGRGPVCAEGETRGEIRFIAAYGKSRRAAKCLLKKNADYRKQISNTRKMYLQKLVVVV